ncbi:MAG: HNH endonuclease [Ilumatobacteraceae bacterium]
MSARAAKICNHKGCINLQPCPDHPKIPWAGSTRRANPLNKRLTEDPKIKVQVLARHRNVCHWCHRPGADQIDHVIPLAEGGRDVLSNLAPIHADPCSKRKTQQEAARGRSRGDRRA